MRRQSIIRRLAMFKRIDHIELLTAAPERVVEFYTGVLGFHVRERMRVPATPQGPLDLVYLDLGGTTVELIHYEGVPVDPAPKLEHVSETFRHCLLPDGTTTFPRNASEVKFGSNLVENMIVLKGRHSQNHQNAPSCAPSTAFRTDPDIP